jgi:hypothetical protein
MNKFAELQNLQAQLNNEYMAKTAALEAMFKEAYLEELIKIARAEMSPAEVGQDMALTGSNYTGPASFLAAGGNKLGREMGLESDWARNPAGQAAILAALGGVLGGVGGYSQASNNMFQDDRLADTLKGILGGAAVGGLSGAASGLVGTGLNRAYHGMFDN